MSRNQSRLSRLRGLIVPRPCRLFRVVTLVLLAFTTTSTCVLYSQLGFGQSVPVPEYFGSYAVVDGKLVKLDADQIRTVASPVRLGQRTAVGQVLDGKPVATSNIVNIAKFTPNLKIVVFSQASGLNLSFEEVKEFHIRPLVFIRNVTVNTGWPSNVVRSGREDGWDTGGAPEMFGVTGGGLPRSLNFLLKPMPGHPEMVIAELPAELRPGVYKLVMGPECLGCHPRWHLFSVGSASEAETAKCADAVVSYAMSEEKVEFTPCGETISSETGTAGGAAVSRASPPSEALTNEDILKMVKAKLGDEVIIAKVKGCRCKFDTSTNTLIKLKQAGVSDSVLQAMTESVELGTPEVSHTPEVLATPAEPVGPSRNSAAPKSPASGAAPGSAPELILHEGHPALSFHSDAGVAVIELVQRESAPSLRFPVKHSHFGDCTGYLYVSADRIAYDPADSPKFQKDAFDLKREEIKSMLLTKEAFSGNNVLAIYIGSRRYLFYLLFDTGVGKTLYGGPSSAAAYQFLNNSLSDFDGARRSLENITRCRSARISEACW
jgi:hypothetical protein